MAININTTQMKSQMDDQIESMGESCTLREYTETYDSNGYLTGSSTSDTSTTILIDPFQQIDHVYGGEGKDVPGTLRALLKSDITLDFPTKRYEIIGEDSTTYEIVDVVDDCIVNGVKCGTDVSIRRRDRL